MLERVGLNLLYLVPREVGGTEIFARRLVGALAAERPETEWVCFAGDEAAHVLPDPAWPANVRVERVRVRARSKPRRILAELSVLPGQAQRAGVQLLHSLGTTAPLHSAMPRVVTVHDLIYHHFPDAFPTPARLGLELLVPAAARRSHRVQVISGHTGREVVGVLGVDPARVDLVPNGLGMRAVARPTPEAELRERLGLGDGPLVLTISAALPHKNLERLIRAMALLTAEPAPTLVLTGHAGRVGDELRAVAREVGAGERVKLTGWVEDADVEGLYGAARAFAYPSLHEGFGLPVLEAMARGVPVACADATALPEVAGDAAELFDPESVAAIAAAIDRLLGDPEHAEALVARGRERAAGFGWDRSARAALESYERALVAHPAASSRRWPSRRSPSARHS